MPQEIRVERTIIRWNSSLESVRSVFSRLLVLTALRDVNTGRYVHYGIALTIGEDATHDLLAGSHEEVFNQWQRMTLPEQMRDLQTHLKGLAQQSEAFGPGRKDRSSKIDHILTTWSQTQPYRDFVPLSASALSREAFLINVTSLVAILRNRVGHGDEISNWLS